MDISIWNYNGLRVVWEIVKVVELLNLIRFVFEVEQIAVSLLYREYRHLLHSAQQIGWLSDRKSLLFRLYCSGVIHS